MVQMLGYECEVPDLNLVPDIEAHWVILSQSLSLRLTE